MIDLKTICPRCLLEKASADIDLEEYKERIAPEDRATGDQYEDRLRLCNACKYLNAGLCGACGCYVELRAMRATSRCPYEKW